jgi:hypothetical protein
LRPHDRTPFKTGAALVVKPGSGKLVKLLAVWAAQIRDTKVQRGRENQDRTQQCPVALTKILIILSNTGNEKSVSNIYTLTLNTEKVIQKHTYWF